MREFKVEQIKESWSGYGKNWERLVAAFETDGWKVLNIQRSSHCWDIWVWMVRDKSEGK